MTIVKLVWSYQKYYRLIKLYRVTGNHSGHALGTVTRDNLQQLTCKTTDELFKENKFTRSPISLYTTFHKFSLHYLHVMLIILLLRLATYKL